jgi:hypothetical protein
MRTTLEISNEHRARLLELAARRGEKGFSGLVAEAIEAYLDLQSVEGGKRRTVLALEGSLTPEEADQIRQTTQALRESWR